MKGLSVFSLTFAAIATIFISSDAFAEIFKTSHRLSGFSTDSRHYIYLESYRNPITEAPQAQLQIVNAPTNSCVEYGCIETENPQESSNPTTKAAETELLKKTAVIRYKLKLNRPAAGRRLPALSRVTNPDGSEVYTFLVKNRKDPLQVLMRQKYIPSVAYGGNADTDRAALQLEIIYNNRRRTLSSLNTYRDNTMKYALREVRLAPNGRSAVILMNTIEPAEQGAVQTTLVQSFPL